MQKINAATNSDAPPVEEDDEDEDGDRGGVSLPTIWGIFYFHQLG